MKIEKGSLFASASGICIGAGSVLIKMFLSSKSLWLLAESAVIGICGFVLLQYALKNQKLHIVVALSAGFSSVASVLGGLFILSEILSVAETTGILLITLGLLLIAFQKS